jgi:uroporphyrinogen decarboxylase
MHFQAVDQPPNFEFGYWAETLSVWHEQGLPDSVDDETSAYAYFGIEDWDMVDVHAKPLKICEYEVLEETDDRLVYRDEWGCVTEINKRGSKSIPHFLEYPVRDRASWQPFKEALDPDAPERWEAFEASIERFQHSERPVGIFAGSLLGIARNVMGFENFAVLPYEDPDLFEEIVGDFGRCTVAVLERAMGKLPFDFGHGWEDICFNNGPIIGPDVYRVVAGPWMRRIADVLTLHGCCVYSTDTDGNINPIADVYLDHGLNTMFPVEVHAGSDPCALRDRYGKRIRLWGGVDKRKLAESKEAIDHEMERLRPYVEQGGFIPTVDHRVPADVPLAHYLHYLDRKREVLGVGGTPHY